MRAQDSPVACVGGSTSIPLGSRLWVQACAVSQLRQWSVEPARLP